MRALTLPNGVRLVQLRNPWGRGEWKGAYADTDLAHWTPQARAATGHSPEDSGDDGIFWCPFIDFARVYDCVNVTPIVTLRCDGGDHTKAIFSGAFTAEQIQGRSPEKQEWVANALRYTQLLLTPSDVGFPIHICLYTNHLQGSAPTELELSAFVLREATDGGRRPIKKEDFFHLVQLGGKYGDWGGRCTMTVTLEEKHRGGTLVLIPELSGGDACGYTLTAVAEQPITLRAAAPGAAGSTEEGVVYF